MFKQIENEKKWEMCRGVGNSFGFNHIEDAHQYMAPTKALEQLLEVVSRGGNLLLNVGPM